MTLTRVHGGTLIDPANGIDQQITDLWMQDGRIVPNQPERKPDRTIDATGMVVMPGGVDMHSHFVGPKVNAARELLARPTFGMDAEESRTLLPGIATTGMRYAGLGYTTAFDAAVPPSYARQAHLELRDLPCIDAGFFVLAGNHQVVLESVSDADEDRIAQFLGFLISQTHGYAPKLVNPGGVEDWKNGRRGGIDNLDQKIDRYRITPRQIIHQLCEAANRIRLPHPIHIHCNRLGMPGNWRTTLETMKALGDRRGHLAHIQFHSYAAADTARDFASAVQPLADYVNAHSNLSIDVGQVMFGSTISMTADSPLGYYLQKISGSPWISHDTEVECGCGISPIEYKHRRRIDALQWAIGLEWFLMVDDPWQVALSTDHPNGASFLAYPEIISLLMSRDLRQEQLQRLHRDVQRDSLLYEIDREYTLSEIAVITRAAPARMLGLTSKGHLGVGADADIAIYSPCDDRQKMFQFPRMVIRGGEIVIDDGELRSAACGKVLSASPSCSEFDTSDLSGKHFATTGWWSD